MKDDALQSGVETMQHISFGTNGAFEKECAAWLTANPTKGRIDWLCDTRCNPEEADMLRDFFKDCDNWDIKYNIPSALHISRAKDLPDWLCEAAKAKGINADDIMVNFDFSIRNRFGIEYFFDVAYNALYGASTLEEMVNEKVELIRGQLGICHSAESSIDDVSWLFDRLLKQAGYYPAWNLLQIVCIAELVEIDNLVYNWRGTSEDGIPFASLEAITGDQADKKHIIVPENISFTWNDMTVTIPVKGLHERALKGLKAVSIIELPATIRLIAAEGFKLWVKGGKIIFKSAAPPIAFYLPGMIEQSVFDRISLVVPEESKEAYNTTEPWCYFKNMALYGRVKSQ